MRQITSFLAILLLSFSAFAQSSLDRQIELARQDANADRQALVRGNVPMTEEEAFAFWPAWEEYRLAMSSNTDRMIRLLQEYAQNYQQMSDLKADQLMTDYFSIRMQNLVIRQQFARKVKALIPAHKVMRVVQIENKLDAAQQMQLAAEIPLVR
jgi:hypothetical protein